jgi:hypothetical protein
MNLDKSNTATPLGTDKIVVNRQDVSEYTCTLDKLIPYNYKVYRASLSQSGLVNESVTGTIFENTIGDIVWSYSSPGVYFGTLANAFPASKLFLPIPVRGFNVINSSGSGLGYYTIYRISDNQIVLQSYNNSDVSANGILSNSPIEIRVYN